MKKIISIIIIVLFLSGSANAIKFSINTNEMVSQSTDFKDIDPLIDLNLTIDILAIRALECFDKNSDADFYLKIWINDELFISPIWHDLNYLYDIYSINTDVSDQDEIVSIQIQLFEFDQYKDKLCDINEQKNQNDVELLYNLKTGRWTGSDYINDKSGYARLSGSSDGSIYTNEYDCEIWFDIYQNDFDNDTLPYWIETNVYKTDPKIDNTGQDIDKDGLPIEWEHRFGYNPLIWDDHSNIDPDQDSINNSEEYLTSLYFLSDPFRKDVFMEFDYMQNQDGTVDRVGDLGFEMAKNQYHKRDIVFHFDTGQIEGGDIIPFDPKTSLSEALEIYNDYFMNNETDNWKRGVFHYNFYVYEQTPGGFAFSGDTWPYMGYFAGTNAIVIANTLIEKWHVRKRLSRDYIYASLIMHEMGHNFGIRFGEPLGCDNRGTTSPLRLSWYLWRNYKSVMNYRYTYSILDYSDGSHGWGDYDDWENIDLSFFEKPSKENILNKN
jgi:hypothetical protein